MNEFKPPNDDELPPTLDYSAPAIEPPKPVRPTRRFGAFLLAMPAFLFGLLFTITGVGTLFEVGPSRHFGDMISPCSFIAIGVGCLYLTHRLGKYGSE